MTQSLGIEQYKLSVVSGGKPALNNLSSVTGNKNIARLSQDQRNYIIPFNNQIKVYSVETRQCVKTLKFANNSLLSGIFLQEEENNESIVKILLGDITVPQQEDAHLITVFTNNGHVIVLNYKGKLVESPKHFKISLVDEKLANVFHSEGNYRFLTTFKDPSQKAHNSLQSYRLYALTFDDAKKQFEVAHQAEWHNIILSNISSNGKLLAHMCKDVSTKDHEHKSISVVSLFDDSVNLSFPLGSILSSQTQSLSSNTRYVSSMAIDNMGQQLAVGFASGVISIVNLADLQIRLLKWHIDSVLSLSFSHDGSYLLSGGWEKVMSLWQLETNSQQFLPRLNGIIIDCQVLGPQGNYYSLILQMTENNSNSDYQFLLLNASDLTSKLSINGPLPVFNSTIKHIQQPISAINTKNSNSITSLNHSKKKQSRKLIKSRRQDFTTNVEINPINKNLYFPHISAVQIFDFYKNEQVNYQYLTSGVNNSMGKVRFELNLQDPIITDLKFTKDGQWMITYEIEYPPNDLLSSKDLTHILKFWTKNDNETNWNLKTKVINPHGISVPITKILPSPRSVNNSQGCLTADNNGGLKFWSFDSHESNWCLKKISLPNFNHFSNSVSLAWSQDGSLIFHGFDDKLQILDFDTFKKFESLENTKTVSEFTLDSEIQTVKLINDTNLIVATRTTLNAINLLQGQVINSFDLYPFVNGVYKNGHMDRLITCDERTGNIALVINQQLTDLDGVPTINYKSRIIIFDSDLSTKLGNFTHHEYISWIGWNYDTDFIFLDIESTLGVVGTTVNTQLSDEVNNEGILDGLVSNTITTSASNSDIFAEQLHKLSSRGKKSDTRDKNTNDNDEDEEDIALEFINGEKKDKLVNMNSFTSMFDNIQNVQMDTFFDRVMKVIT
ncbi:U3 snoRNP protein [Saccharomyces cerevisiae YJM789]|uniref:U3 snoRNP protein n=1 Tax=Saccharomyces cerevisiae (strain YJM789) TaxID=307796 RepID=A6ZWC6_YEAS7|nr:U3 snoRNP protein [Saccharomyces cerevisiae YJM789]